MNHFKPIELDYDPVTGRCAPRRTSLDTRLDQIAGWAIEAIIIGCAFLALGVLVIAGAVITGGVQP